jgi:hypothetical protein
MAEQKTNAQMILEKFKRAKTKRESNKDGIWQELDAFDRNQQWDLKASPDWLPKPVTNFVHLVKYTKRAALAMENPTGKLRPVSPAGQQSVQELNEGFQYTWERIKGRKVVRQNIETAKLLGTAIAHVYWNENKEGRLGTTIQGDEGYQFEGEICIKEIDVSSFYPDPNAFSLEECEFVHIVERKPISWLKKHPKFKQYMGTIEKLLENNDNPLERGEFYIRDYTTETKGLIDFHSHYEKEPNDEGGFNYYVTYVAGDKQLGPRQQLRPNRYPFAILYDFPQRHDFWGMSTCQFILDNQRIINKVESIIAMIGTLMQNPQRIVSRQSGINPNEMSTYGNLPGMTWVSNDDPTRSVHYIQPPNIPQVLFSLLENAKANIREITGLTEAYLGQTVGSLQTSSGVQSLIERATMRDRDQMYDIELYIEELSKLIIDFMTEYYEEERTIRIMGQNPDEYSFKTFLGAKYKDLDYDLFIDVSAKAPVTRMREAQEAKDLLNMQGQFGFTPEIIKPQEVVDMMDFANKNQLIKRMNLAEMQNKVDQAMRVASMITEALQQGVEEEEVMTMATQMFQQMDEEAKQGQGNVAQMQSNVGVPQGAGGMEGLGGI